MEGKARQEETTLDEEDRIQGLMDGTVEPEMQSLGATPGVGGSGLDWNEIPVWKLDRLLHFADSGLTCFVIGHKGSGKTRATTALCTRFSRFIDRIQVVSSTEVITGAFTTHSGICDPVYVHSDPGDDFAKMLLAERRGHMQQCGRDRERRQQSMLVIMDDVAHSKEVLMNRSREMTQLTTTTRQLKLFMVILVQSIGYVGKFLREQADLVIIGRESLAATLEATWMVYFKGVLPMWVFRDMVDKVCVNGEQVLLVDLRNGGTVYRVPLEFDHVHLPQPIGNKAWRQWAEQRRKPHTLEWQNQGETSMVAAARERWRPPEPKGRGRRRK